MNQGLVIAWKYRKYFLFFEKKYTGSKINEINKEVTAIYSSLQFWTLCDLAEEESSRYKFWLIFNMHNRQ